MIKIIMPNSIRLNSNKHYPLNLNHYRNVNSFTSGSAKEIYEKKVKKQLKNNKPIPKITVLMKYHHGNNNRFDEDNVTSIHRKFFQDSLVKAKFIEDDTHEFIEFFPFIAEMDIYNPRSEFIITPHQGLIEVIKAKWFESDIGFQ